MSVNVGQTYDSDPSTPADDQNNTPATAPILAGANLYVSHLIRGDVDYYRVPIGPFGSEQPRVVATEELERRFHTRSRAVRTSLEQLGFLREVGNGQVEEVTPMAFRGGEVFADLGVPVLPGQHARANRLADARRALYQPFLLDHV